MRYSGQTRGLVSKIAGIGVLLIGFLLAATLCFGGPADPSQIPSILPAAVDARGFDFSVVASGPDHYGRDFRSCLQPACVCHGEISQARRTTTAASLHKFTAAIRWNLPGP